MKVFINTKTEIPIPRNRFDPDTQMIEACFGDLACICLRTKQDGFSGTEMRERFRLIDQLEFKTPGQKILLQDADASLLIEIVKASKWKEMHRDVLTFEDMVFNMENHELPEYDNGNENKKEDKKVSSESSKKQK